MAASFPAAAQSSSIAQSDSTTQGPTIIGPSEQPVHWRNVFRQAGLLFGVQQSWRIAFQADTRSQLKGPYFKDYINSLKGIGGWRDGDPVITNYVGHPMTGSTAAWILVQNDPQGAAQVFDVRHKPYWVSRVKGLWFATGYSTFYELSPVGDAAIGNVGLDHATKGFVDLVITPSVGMGWNLAEDAMDKYVISWVERRTGNRALNMLARIGLNPTRSIANTLRFKTPWRRDSRGGLRRLHRQQEIQELAHNR